MRSKLNTKQLLEQLEKSVVEVNPKLAERLLPGIPEEKIVRLLQKHQVHNSVSEIVSVFAWKNGCRLDPSMSGFESLFPNTGFMFLNFKTMLHHFESHKECAVVHSRLAADFGCSFPLFWDGSVDWLAIGIADKNSGKIVRLSMRDGSMPSMRTHDTLDDLINEAIKANAWSGTTMRF